mmetsp:Transcript_4905/g.8490  ORF Transcript_4905/g.8490 Transcript_4905/m.8490 type:complete len:247 (+) Transcript_4905:1156-1896(+)
MDGVFFGSQKTTFTFFSTFSSLFAPFPSSVSTRLSTFFTCAISLVSNGVFISVTFTTPPSGFHLSPSFVPFSISFSMSSTPNSSLNFSTRSFISSRLPPAPEPVSFLLPVCSSCCSSAVDISSGFAKASLNALRLATNCARQSCKLSVLPDSMAPPCSRVARRDATSLSCCCRPLLIFSSMSLVCVRFTLISRSIAFKVRTSCLTSSSSMLSFVLAVGDLLGSAPLLLDEIEARVTLARMRLLCCV